MHIGEDDPLETFRKVLQMLFYFFFTEVFPISVNGKSVLAVVRPKPHTMLYSFPPNFKSMTRSTELYHLMCFGIQLLLTISTASSFHLCSSIQNSPTPLYSQHSSLIRSAEMEDLSCQLLARNCPLAMHLIQHKSLNPFCLKGPDPVLVLHCSPHCSHADLLTIPTHQASFMPRPAASHYSLLEGSSQRAT